MSHKQQLTGMLEDFLASYYKPEIARIAKEPNDRQSLWVDYTDLWTFDPDLADDFRDQPDEILPYLEEAITLVDVPLDVDLSHVTVRVSGLNEEHVHSPSELREEHGGKYVGVSGILERVTSTSDLPEVLCFQCQRCGTKNRVPQDATQTEIQEPHECRGCERQGPFSTNHTESEFSDYAKIRVQARPDTDSEGKIPGYILNDLIEIGGDSGVLGRAGEPVTVYGIVERVQKSGKGQNNLLFDHFVNVKAIEFDRDEETVDVEAHRDAFEALAGQPDAVDKFAQSIAPHLHETDAWGAAFEFAVAYLFGAPRIDLNDGPTYRGDLHFLIVSDYGMGKSDFSTGIERYSPQCISKSTTALSSGVGLTAAAVKDDFGEGQWTLKPGLLVKANGGHLILDEIDKGPDELTDMNDALEGKQQVDVEKAGQSATYESRCGLLALGNPVDGRFDPTLTISEQLGISESLLSRFDGIVTMADTPDVDMDSKVAQTFGKSYTEAQEKEHGDREELDVLDPEVPVDVGRAWVKFARENVDPLLSYDQFKELETWYAEEVRQLNNEYGSGEAEDMPVPATVRNLGAAVKMSIAFARAHLREEVKPQDVQRAKRLAKKLIKQNWDGEKFDATRELSQHERINSVLDAVQNSDGISKSAIISAVGESESKVEHEISKLKEQGEIYEPTNGEYVST